MIKIDLFEETIFQTIKRGATELSKDVKLAFEDAIIK